MLKEACDCYKSCCALLYLILSSAVARSRKLLINCVRTEIMTQLLRKLIFQNSRFFLTIASTLLVLPFFSNLRADLLSLKNGNEIEGFFLREYTDKIAFQDLDGKKHIVSSLEIEQVEIGLSGVPACYLWEGDDPDEKECSVLLVRIDEKEIMFAKGKGFRQIKKIDIDDLDQVELLYKNYPFQTLPPIQKGLQAQVETKRALFAGKVVDTGQKHISLKGKKGRRRRYKIRNVKKILISFTEEAPTDTVKKGSKPEKLKAEGGLSWFHYISYVTYIFPGWPQYRQGQKWKGALMLTSYSLLLRAMALEYSQANSVGNKAKQSESAADISEQEEIFNKHQKNQAYYGYALLGIYSWHVLDLIFFDDNTQASSRKKSTYQATYASFFPVFQENSERPALGFNFSGSF